MKIILSNSLLMILIKKMLFYNYLNNLNNYILNKNKKAIKK